MQTFRNCFSQWRYAASGAILGLDYPGVDIVLRRARLDNADAVFADIQLMESVALAVFREQAAQQE